MNKLFIVIIALLMVSTFGFRVKTAVETEDNQFGTQAQCENWYSPSECRCLRACTKDYNDCFPHCGMQ